MTGNEIRKQYMADKDLLKAIDNTLTMLETVDYLTLQNIQRTILWDVCIRDYKSKSVAIGALVQVVSVITKIEDKERIIKCIYKGKYEGMYKIHTLRSGLRNMGQVASHK